VLRFFWKLFQYGGCVEIFFRKYKHLETSPPDFPASKFQLSIINGNSFIKVDAKESGQSLLSESLLSESLLSEKLIQLYI